MCLQTWLQRGVSIALVAILLAQSHKSELKTITNRRNKQTNELQVGIGIDAFLRIKQKVDIS